MNKAVHLFTSEKLINILSLSQNATAIYTTGQIIIQTANDAMIRFRGKDRSIIGQPLEEAVQELKGQPFIDIIRNVWNTGVTYDAKDTSAILLVDSELQTFFLISPIGPSLIRTPV